MLGSMLRVGGGRTIVAMKQGVLATLAIANARDRAGD